MPRHVLARDGQRLWRGNAAQTRQLCSEGTDIPKRRIDPAANNAGAARHVGRLQWRALAAVVLACAIGAGLAHSARAETATQAATGATADPILVKPPAPTPDPKALAAAEAEKRMLVIADQSVYDRPASAVTLTGRVQIYYNRSTLTADQVVYYTMSKRVIATGHVRLTEPGGNLLIAEKLDVTQGFQTGFVEALKVESTDRTEFDAKSAERKEGNITIFHDGNYNACQYCEITHQPPFWQIRAKTITSNQTAKTVTYNDAELVFDGTPVIYLPYFEHPDPTVTRQTGFLLPTYSVSTNLGLAVSSPFYWAPTKDWDATLQPAYLTKQGFLGDVQIRHAFEDGTVSVRAIGINQTDPGAFLGTSGDRVKRGAFITTGQFTINENFKWGFDATLLSDRRFLLDYHEATSSAQEATSQIYLTGLGERTFFDARAYAFQIFNDDDTSLPNGIGTDLQNKQPGVGVVDYDIVFADPVLGGQLSSKFNATNVYRSVTDIGTGSQVYGVAGDFSRASVDVNWQRQFIDKFGQVFEPFAYVKGDLFYNNPSSQAAGAGVNYIQNGSAFRGMPAIGLEYRYPWLITSSFGNHILEPIAQIIARPNEQLIGRLPNEDAQSLVFDDTTLFQADKFSGFDRQEGGTRANVGLQYTYQGPHGASINALFGQSYLFAGENSFDRPQLQALEQMAASGQAIPLSYIGSGLSQQVSDYVSRFNLDTGMGIRIGTSQRFAEKDFSLRRSDMSLAGTFGALTASIDWAYLRTPKSEFALINALDPTLLTTYPNLLQAERSEIQGSLSLKVSEDWRVFGGSQYDIKNHFAISDMVGVGYDNDSFSAALTFSANTNQTLTQPTPTTSSQILTDRIVYLKFGFRTLGDGSISNSSNVNANTNTTPH
jgi:LPS-assembly protein